MIYAGFTKPFHWNSEKNETLIRERGVSFEQVVMGIEVGGLLDVLQHHKAERYPNQKILVVRLNEYVYLVPTVETDDFYFLKTIIPSRKAKRQYPSGDHHGQTH